jgi:hypothetical protein
VPFETIYDIQRDGCRYGILPVIIAVPLLLSAFDWYRGKRWVGLDGKPYPGYSPQVACVFFAIMAVVAFVATWGDYFHLLRSIENHQVETLEGTISGFHAAATIKSTESFDVAGHTFSFKKFATKQGFNTLSLEGSPAADGRTVRVHHVQGQIVKLEIAPL